MVQHAVMKASQRSRVRNLVEMVVQKLDKQASQGCGFRCDVCLWAGEHHVHNGLGRVKAGVCPVPQLD